MKKCKQCNSDFEAKRATAQYCSAKCRKLAFQNVSVLSVPSLSVLQDNGIKPEHIKSNALPDNFGLADCSCQHCRQCRTNNTTPLKRVTLPGDVDYQGCGSQVDVDARRAQRQADSQAHTLHTQHTLNSIATPTQSATQ